MLALGLSMALAATGCARRAAPPEDAAARAQALVESGNVAYRAEDFRTAARRYGAAAVVRPDDPAAYYGLGMALARLGRDEEARAAYTRARELARAADSTGGGRAVRR
jgi:Flp pilus assembly protein TadD